MIWPVLIALSVVRIAIVAVDNDLAVGRETRWVGEVDGAAAFEVLRFVPLVA